MSTKTCPSCGADVPEAAPRCKHCFHDFTEVAPRSSSGLMGLLGLIAAMAVAGAAFFYAMRENQASEHIVVDKETTSIIFTTKYADRTETDRISFDDVAKVEMIIGGDIATFEVYVVTLSGESHLVNQSKEKTLRGYAERIASVMDKPYIERSVKRGFGGPTEDRVVPAPSSTSGAAPKKSE
ncbi:zinc ribbon domain-containing protein [Myxococcota bacterium]|nr:zinc ribbon domain-containing protein [Myxococcota bacterium]